MHWGAAIDGRATECPASECTNGSTLHPPSPIPDRSEFLPRFLPKDAPRPNRDVVSPGHSRRLKQATRVCHQPSKLVMQVRFPAAVPQNFHFADNSGSAVRLTAVCALYWSAVASMRATLERAGLTFVSSALALTLSLTRQGPHQAKYHKPSFRSYVLTDR